MTTYYLRPTTYYLLLLFTSYLLLLIYCCLPITYYLRARFVVLLRSPSLRLQAIVATGHCCR